ncbi:hypothetical protein P171DRAFT_485501 [Karstenula rhodostoma CBS 690.94]|uniref:Uncharacterized protein n=1 Tax=Karstenula rhodostoma CBS 690.94 TaxID=1392251 RepID=A0A9P4PIZ5_9PLEO|nr:hypothetical protein P171DRAFT_485501 [Karstenula rhodostoma CBS 690.94]
MSPLNKDVEKGLGGKAEATVDKAGPAPRSYPEKKKRDAYLERFWKYCEERSIDVIMDHFRGRSKDLFDPWRMEMLALDSATIVKRDGVFAVHNIGLEAVSQLGASFDIDPGFFAYHLNPAANVVTTESYWSIPCSVISYEGSERVQGYPWTGRISFTILKTKIILLLVDDVSRPSTDSLELPMLAEHETGLQKQSRLYNAYEAEHFKKLFMFPPATELLRSLSRNPPTNTYIARTTFDVLMRLTTWELSLDKLAAVARELDSDATVKPSKAVLQRLNKCRSLVVQVLNDVIQLRETIKHTPSVLYSALCYSMVAVKQQHPDFDWIPGLQNANSLDAAATDRARRKADDVDDGKPDISLLLRMLSRMEQQAEKASAQLRGTFQTLTTAITIEDSEFNKKQAERSTMLTLLAAVYLPLTLATGIFGMNIQEINGATPRWWVVIVVTAVLFIPSISFMIMLFAGERIKEKFAGESIKKKFAGDSITEKFQSFRHRNGNQTETQTASET